MRMRRRAVRALMSHTQNAIRDLRNDEDEMLRGAALLSNEQPQHASPDSAPCCVRAHPVIKSIDQRSPLITHLSKRTALSAELSVVDEACKHLKLPCIWSIPIMIVLNFAGVDWGAVEKYVSIKDCYEHYKDPTAASKSTRKWYKPWTLFKKKSK